MLCRKENLIAREYRKIERAVPMSIILDKVSHIYGADTTMAVIALKNISLVIPDGQFIGLIGHTGSGKSTLVQHLNGLMKATSGNIYFNG